MTQHIGLGSVKRKWTNRRGREASPLLPVYWERHFEESLESVRARYGVRPWTDAEREAARPFRWTGPVVANVA